MPVLRFDHVSKQFDNEGAARPAVNDVSLTIEPGELVVLIGPSGCGKTTLLNILGLLDVPTDGEYHLAGQAVAGLAGP